MSFRRWFYSLRGKEKSLLDYYNYEVGNLIICREGEYGLSYTLFQDFLEFKNFFIETKSEERTFFEVIVGNYPQKFYLDIDAKTDVISEEQSLAYISEVRDKVREFFCALTPFPFNILVFSSCGGTKISYHIVVDKVCVINHLQNKHIFQKFMETLDPEQSKFIDISLMKSTQNFRLVGCTKYSHNRYKRLTSLSINREGESYTIKEEGRIFLIKLLQESLISATQICVCIPPFEIKKKREFNSNAIIVVDEGVLESIEMLYRKEYEVSEYDDVPYSILDVVQEEENYALVICKRNEPSYCKLCQRIHEHQNPFFIICGEEYNIFWNCRRTEKKLFLGKLKKVSPPPKECSSKESLEKLPKRYQPPEPKPINLDEFRDSQRIFNGYSNSKPKTKSGKTAIPIKIYN